MKIEKLTEEQEKMISVYTNLGLEIGNSTEPANWDLADDAMIRLYKFIRDNNKDNDELNYISCDTIYHCASPLEAQKLITKLTGVNEFHNTHYYGYGQHENFWIYEFLYYQDVLKLDFSNINNGIALQGFNIFKDLSHSCGWHYILDDCAVICDRPKTIKLNDQFKKHSTSGPAIEFRDGFRIYAYNDYTIPNDKSWIIDSPENINVNNINNENNAEIRRIMIDIFGIEKYLKESGAEYLDMDAGINCTGSAPRFLVKDSNGDKWLIGSDGSTKRTYIMPAPQEANTAKEAHNIIAGVDESRIIAEC